VLTVFKILFALRFKIMEQLGNCSLQLVIAAGAPQCHVSIESHYFDAIGLSPATLEAARLGSEQMCAGHLHRRSMQGQAELRECKRIPARPRGSGSSVTVLADQMTGFSQR